MSSEENPWKKLSSKQVYSNPWISIREDQVIRPDGQEGIYGVVEPRLAVGVLVLDDRDRVCLVGQYRYPIDVYSWEIIEGGAEDGEDALSTAQRELREEAGLIANSWEKLCPDVFLSNCFSSERAVFFLARDLVETQAQPDATEILKLKTVSFEECLQMVKTGEITDSMSVIAITSYALR